MREISGYELRPGMVIVEGSHEIKVESVEWHGICKTEVHVNERMCWDIQSRVMVR